MTDMTIQDTISGHTCVCGLIGDPVEHTLSPLIHNTLAARMGCDLAYVPFRVSHDALGSAVRGAYDLNIRGLNVTVPHKIDVMESLAGIDEHARAIGAVNTLVRCDGGYIGYNTDYIGLKRALATDGVSPAGRDIVILGAGGAARSAVYLCAFEGARSVYVLNRSVDRAAALCDEVNAYVSTKNGSVTELCKPLPLSEHASVEGEDLIAIQASSVGLHPHDEDVIIADCDLYDRIGYGYDLVYNPACTGFMKLVRGHGGRASCGLSMLLYQAVAAFELWMDVSVPDETAAGLIKVLEEAAR